MCHPERGHWLPPVTLVAPWLWIPLGAVPRMISVFGGPNYLYFQPLESIDFRLYPFAVVLLNQKVYRIALRSQLHLGKARHSVTRSDAWRHTHTRRQKGLRDELPNEPIYYP